MTTRNAHFLYDSDEAEDAEDHALPHEQPPYEQPPSKNRGQFKKGVSGNPKGRPKGKKRPKPETRTDLIAAHDATKTEKVPVEIDGRVRWLTTYEVGCIRLANRFAQGDLKAANAVLRGFKTNAAAAETHANASVRTGVLVVRRPALAQAGARPTPPAPPIATAPQQAQDDESIPVIDARFKPLWRALCERVDVAVGGKKRSMRKLDVGLYRIRARIAAGDEKFMRWEENLERLGRLAAEARQKRKTSKVGPLVVVRRGPKFDTIQEWADYAREHTRLPLNPLEGVPGVTPEMLAESPHFQDKPDDDF